MVVHKCCDHTTKCQETLKKESENENENESEMVNKCEKNGEGMKSGGMQEERNEGQSQGRRTG